MEINKGITLYGLGSPDVLLWTTDGRLDICESEEALRTYIDSLDDALDIKSSPMHVLRLTVTAEVVSKNYDRPDSGVLETLVDVGRTIDCPRGTNYLFSVKLLYPDKEDTNQQKVVEEFHVARDIREVWAHMTPEIEDTEIEVDSITRIVPITSIIQ